MNEIKCGNCVKFKTQYCPCTIDCMATDDYPYFQNRYMILEENQQLKDKLQQSEEVIQKAIEKLSFIDDALEKDILNVPLCITKINKAIDILNKYQQGDSEQ